MLRDQRSIAMALLQSSGAISFSDIKGMYGGSTNISMGNYIKSGSFVPNAPSSGNIPSTKVDMNLSKFYGTAKEYMITVATTTTNYNWQSAFAAAHPSPTRSTDYIARLIVNSGVTVGATATSSYALAIGGFPAAARLYIDNYGSIQGAGGAGASLADGDGLSGGPALNADVVQTTTITIKNGASIYGGGGGGGKGGAGGTGGKGGNGSYDTYNEQYSRNNVTETNDYYVILRWTSPSKTTQNSSSWVWAGGHFCSDGQIVYRGANGLVAPSGAIIGSYTHTSPVPGYIYGSTVRLISDFSGYAEFRPIIKVTANATTGGTGGAGGSGGNGGRGAGYNQTVATGNGGNVGDPGNAGGTNAGTGGTGGTGGKGGNGGGLGSGGFPGDSGNQGGTGGSGGAAGGSGASGTTAGSAGRSVFKNGRSTVIVTVESGATILPAAA